MKRVFSFLKEQCKSTRPFLLALSGGPDSLLLFYLLLEWGHPFSVVHVDHRWRKTSSSEAKQLEALCQRYGITFYLHTLNPDRLSGNLEDVCRNERYAIFYQCYQKGYQALILGHQADDQAETVLKRVLEGSSLVALSSIKMTSFYKDMPLWRPLLTTPKKEILKSIEERKLQPFLDPTNQDINQLRARMRIELIPYLNQNFGKEVTSSLCRLAEEAQELKGFIDTEYLDCTKCLIKGPFGILFDLTSPRHPFILRALVKKFAFENGIMLSHEELKLAVNHIFRQDANKWINQKLYLDRGNLFLIKKTLSHVENSLPLSCGNLTWGDWKVAISFCKEEIIPKTHWMDVWKGNVVLTVPEGNYSLAPCFNQCDKWWTKNRVPAFFRTQIPVLWREGEIFWEFLTGKPFRQKRKGFMQIHLSTKICET